MGWLLAGLGVLAGMAIQSSQIPAGLNRTAMDAASLGSPSHWQALLRTYQPRLSGRRQGRAVRAAITDSGSPAGQAFQDVITGFVRSDDSYRLVVTPQLRADVERREDYVRVDFASGVLIHPSHKTNPISVRAVLLPLSGRWAKAGWTFFFEDADRGEWFALSWANPDAALVTHMFDAVDRMEP